MLAPDLILLVTNKFSEYRQTVSASNTVHSLHVGFRVTPDLRSGTVV